MISADMVKDLRDKTGAGMMDCKRALTAANGDMDLAIENLRKSGVAKAEKKVGRATNNGKVLSAIDGKSGALVEVLCETDFAANTDKFINFVNGIAVAAAKLAKNGDVSELVNQNEIANLTEKIATIGENMQIRRVVQWTSAGALASYHHMGGRVSVLIDVEGETDPEVLNDICLHIAAFKPTFITPSDVPADVIAKEKEIALAADPKLVGKPAEMIEKILVGKINKYFGEVCLMNQPWIRDDKTTLAKFKPSLKVKRFIRWEVGEEI